MDAVEHQAVPVTVLTHLEPGGADHRLVDLPGGVDSRLREEIARNVLADELVEGDVRIEGADQIVPITPRTLDLGIRFIAVGVAVTNHVHPVPRPLLSKMGRVQQAVHLLGVSGVRVGIPEEGGDFFGLRGKSCQQIAHPPQQGVPIGARSRSQAIRLQLGQEKAIDGLVRPLLPSDLRYRRFRDGLQGPPAAAVPVDLLPIGMSLVRRGSFRPRGVPRSGRPQAHPSFEDVDQLSGQLFAAQGHGQPGPLVTDGSNQKARLGIPRDDGRPRLAALLPTIRRVKPQFSLRKIGTVADETVFGQSRTDVPLEEFPGFGRDIDLTCRCSLNQAEDAEENSCQDRRQQPIAGTGTRPRHV